MEAGRADPAEHAREEQRGDDEQRPLESVVVAVVHGGMHDVRAGLVPQLLRLEDLAEDGDVGEPEAQLGGDPRQREQDQGAADDDSDSIAPHARGP